MMHKEFDWKFIGVYVLAVLLSIGGGMAKHASLWQVGQAKFSLGEIVAQTTISFFSGVLVTLYMSNQGYDIEIILIGAGLGGFAGATLLYIFTDKVLKQIDPNSKGMKETQYDKGVKDEESSK